MASHSGAGPFTKTLTTTTADTVSLTSGPWAAIEVTNHDATTTLYVRLDGTTAVSAADGTTPILPRTTKVIRSRIYGGGTAGVNHLVSVVGNGNIFTVEGVN